MKKDKIKSRTKNDLLQFRIAYGNSHNATLFYSTNELNGIFSNFASLPFQLTNQFPHLEKYPALIQAAQQGLAYFQPYDQFFDVEWKTSEHLFQAAKFGGQQISEEALQRIEDIRLSANPGRAARLGRIRDGLMRADWEEIKKDVMFVALIAKTNAHKQMQDTLLNTGDSLIVEDTVTSNDTAWGCGVDGLGVNLLGKLLMAVRAGLQTSDDQQKVIEEVEGWLQEARKGQGLKERPSYLPTLAEEAEFMNGNIVKGG